MRGLEGLDGNTGTKDGCAPTRRFGSTVLVPKPWQKLTENRAPPKGLNGFGRSTNVRFSHPRFFEANDVSLP